MVRWSVWSLRGVASGLDPGTGQLRESEVLLLAARLNQRLYTDPPTGYLLVTDIERSPAS
jgi:hypothetical protein